MYTILTCSCILIFLVICILQVLKWKVKFAEKSPDQLPLNLRAVANECMEVFYPNIQSIFILPLTIPVGTCSCERSFSSLRRPKTWLRTTMSEKHLNGLTLMSIYSESEAQQSLSPLAVLKRWDGGCNRKTALTFNNGVAL